MRIGVSEGGGNRALRQSVPSGFLSAVEAGQLHEVLHAIAANEQLLQERDPEGRSAFLLACLHGHLGIVKALAEDYSFILTQKDADPQRGGGGECLPGTCRVHTYKTASCSSHPE